LPVAVGGLPGADFGGGIAADDAHGFSDACGEQLDLGAVAQGVRGAVPRSVVVGVESADVEQAEIGHDDVARALQRARESEVGGLEGGGDVEALQVAVCRRQGTDAVIGEHHDVEVGVFGEHIGEPGVDGAEVLLDLRRGQHVAEGVGAEDIDDDGVAAGGESALQNAPDAV